MGEISEMYEDHAWRDEMCRNAEQLRNLMLDDAARTHAKLREFCAWLGKPLQPGNEFEAARLVCIDKLRELGLWVDP